MREQVTEEQKVAFVTSTIQPMAWHTFPFVSSLLEVESNESGRHIGSAVRLERDGRRLLVTAAHVARQTGAGRFAATGIRGRAPIELNGPPSWQDDVLDVAIFELPQDYPAVAFWPEDRIERDLRTIEEDFLFLHGFPQSRTYSGPLLGGVVNESLPYGAMSRDWELPRDMRSSEFALDFDGANMRLETGEAAEWLDPAGLSGSPVWRIGAAGLSVSEWTPDKSRLVGIVTKWKPDQQLILATKIDEVMRLIASASV